ncbi:porphobilinogen deaminase [Musa troglodytarum]|uniref:Porphobilinogen deaminase n=1 Tax=Musa troglodytarum TaxID=320322 RepID=A0A9E7HNW9_9LILI|nr:porphobilinogen deaminase [Musa troglodytarum]
MAASYILLLSALLALASSPTMARDPGALQDFCVADNTSDVFVNGLACKDPKLVMAEDFFFSGLDEPRNTTNKVGSNVTLLNASRIPGLNTLGISMARLDFAPYGLNPPHVHPRATEILTVLEGSLYVGFVTSNPDNRLFAKVLTEGDVFVFPQGLVHFQFNHGTRNAVALAALSSQNPGVITIANAVFGSKPAISDDVLAQAFQVDDNTRSTKLLSLLPSPRKDMAASYVLLLAALLALASSPTMARDPGALQDFCVADNTSDVFVNGFVCKDPKLVKAEDFFFSGLDEPRDTTNKVGSNVTLLNASRIPGLNTLGISMARVDYAPFGLNPPHIHPRATEIQTVLEGSLYVGFVTSNPDNRLVTKVVRKGDVFVFPQGLIHFQFNLGAKPAVAVSGLSSQNPGVITIANSVFGSKPAISDDILAKAFQFSGSFPLFTSLNMAAAYALLLAALLALASSPTMARDPGALQDLCVADNTSNVFVNGFVCKDPKLVKAEDFFFSGLDEPRDTTNKVGSNVTLLNASRIPGLNTLGISMARVDYAPFGLNPPHIHPRATEIQTVLEGSLYVGFVTSNPDNRLVTKVVRKGDVFVFPQGLIHFQFNLGAKPAVAVSGLSSQNPGVITIANSVFGSKPAISDDILAKAFQVDKKIIDRIQAHF